MKMKQAIANASKRIGENYKNADVPIYGEKKRLPDKDMVIEIIHDFQKVFFPMYFGDKDLLLLPPEEYASLMLHRIYRKLRAQLELALDDDPCMAGRAEEVCLALIESVPEIQQKLMKDLSANFEGDPAASSKEEVIFAYPGLFAIFIYRIAHELYVQQVPMIPRIMSEYAHSLTGIDINPGATIGEYFFIDHGTGIVVGETSVIGDHVRMYQGATLGALAPYGARKNTGKRRHPVVKDNVTIYSGATILGGDTVIGENTVVGGNTFLTQSVESNMTVSLKTPEMHFRDNKRTL
ncbi:MAG: serine acetyltransferase [Clostridiales bacterium]|jgi:serine O-acetyltransferase|nr:serine acetyltransferase [Clostridiales bacterium]